MEIIDKLNDILFEIQMRKRFKKNPKAPKVCMYCGKNLKNVPKCDYGVWVYGNGDTFYDCKECANKLKELTENFYQSFCDSYRLRKERPIERCLCCPKHEECVKGVKQIEENLCKIK